MLGNSANVVIRILSDARDGIRGLDQTESKLRGVGRVAGGAVVAGVGAAGVALVGLGVAGGKSASDLEQSVGGIDAVFKGTADQAHRLAEQADQANGLTQNSYNELATVIGSQLKNAGTSMDELVPKTDELIDLGSDLASVYGGDTKTAVDALSSALKGERDPIEAYGVSLRQSAIDAKAAELGFEKVGGALSAEANQAATLALIMEQTTDAHGNFAKEADTTAGQQQRLVASAQDLVAQLGTALLPVLLAVFTFLNTTAVPAVTGLVDAFTAGGAGGGLATRLGLDALQPILATVIPLLQSVGAAVATFVLGTLIPAGQQIAANFRPNIDALVGVVLPALVGAFRTVVPAILPVVTSIVSLAVAVSGRLAPVFLALVPVVTTAFSVVASIVRGALALVSSIITTVTAVIRGDWSAAWDGVVSILDNAGALIGTIIDGALALVVSLVTSGLDAVLALFGTSWEEIGTATSNGIDAVIDFVTALPGRILSGLGDLGGLLTSAGQDLVSGFIGGIRDMAGRAGDAAMEVARAAADRVKQFLGIASPSRLFRDLGQFTGQGLVIGLEGQRRAVERAAGDLLGKPDQLARRMSPVEVAFGADRRTGPTPTTTRPVINITINGAIDKVGTARELRQLLADEALLSGKVALP